MGKESDSWRKREVRVEVKAEITEEETAGEVKVIEAEVKVKRTGEVMEDTGSEGQELQMTKAEACQVSMLGCSEDKGEIIFDINRH